METNPDRDLSGEGWARVGTQVLLDTFNLTCFPLTFLGPVWPELLRLLRMAENIAVLLKRRDERVNIACEALICNTGVITRIHPTVILQHYFAEMLHEMDDEGSSSLCAFFSSRSTYAEASIRPGA